MRGKWWTRAILRVLPDPWRHLVWQMATRAVHDPDVHLFARLDGLRGTVLDIGANKGQFALSVFAVNRGLAVESWEPNPSLHPLLRVVRLRHPVRFRWRPWGAGATRRTATLHIPATRSVDLSPNASLMVRELSRRHVAARMQGAAGSERIRIHERAVPLLPVDATGLSPVAVKIDVEGSEPDVLRGMAATLSRCHPLLMIEDNHRSQVLGILHGLGYAVYVVDHDEWTLRPLESWPGETLNLIALHPESPPRVLAALGPMISLH